MQYKVNNKTINIPDSEINNSMKALDLTKEEAIQLWLEDNDYEENEEQNALDEKAKKVKIQHGAVEEKPKTAKPRTVKISDEKKQLFHTIYSAILEYENSNVEILKENKLFQIKIGEKIFKVDVIEQRTPKK